MGFGVGWAVGGHHCCPRPLGGWTQAAWAKASIIAPSAAAELIMSNWVPFAPYQQPPTTSPTPRILKYRGISLKEEEGWDPWQEDGMDQRRDAQPWCRGSSSLCVLEAGGGVCGSAKKPSDDHPRELCLGRPSWLAPTQAFTRGGTHFSGCEGPGGSLILTELSQGGKLSLPG